MNVRVFPIVTLALLAVSITLAGCGSTPNEPCTFSANDPLTAYRLPDNTSDVFGELFSGDTYQVLARTAEGWVGFEPAVAQAGNVGLARYRWVFLNASISPSCLTDLDLVTLADVEADLAASGQ
jgi:hypothetical protein